MNSGTLWCRACRPPTFINPSGIMRIVKNKIRRPCKASVTAAAFNPPSVMYKATTTV